MVNQKSFFSLPDRKILLPVTFVLALITIVGIFLRLRYLGDLGLDRYQDEDLMAIAVLGILEHGYPLYPSGMIYTRALPQLYLMAASAGVFGFTEFALRFPSTLFGAGLILLSYFLARRSMGLAPAILVAVLVCFSAWQIDVSRTARMYAPFAFFFTLAVMFFNTEYVDARRNWPWKTLIAAMVSSSLQVLSLSLALLFFLHLFERPYWRVRWPHVFLGTVFVSFTLAVDKINKRFFAMYESRSDTVVEVSPGASEPDPSVFDSFRAAFSMLFEMPMELFTSTYSAGMFLVVGSMIGAAVVGGSLVALRRSGVKWFRCVLAVLPILAALLHQFHLAFLLGLVLLITSENNRWKARFGQVPVEVLIVVVTLVVSFVFWAGVAFVHYEQSFPLRDIAIQFLNFPRMKPWILFFADRPLLIPFVAIGILAAFLLNRQTGKLDSIGVIAWTVLGSMILTGTLENQYRDRYNFQVDAIAYILVLFSIGLVIGWTAKKWHHKGSSVLLIRYSRLITISVVASLLLTPGFNPIKAYVVTGASEASWSEVVDQFALERRTDRKSTSLYAKADLRKGDLVASVDFVTSYAYIGRNDYWIRSVPFQYQETLVNSVKRDTYLHSEILSKGKELAAVISELCERRLWLIIPASEFRVGNKSNESLEAFYRKALSNIVYRGYDGSSAVYLFDRSAIVCKTDSG